MEHERDDDEAIRDAVSSVDELTAELVEQLDALRGRLREGSARELAGALGELQDRVGELLDVGADGLTPAALRSLDAIADATERIEHARLRLQDELAAPVSAEAALRAWTRSAPGDGRVRPDADAAD